MQLKKWKKPQKFQKMTGYALRLSDEICNFKLLSQEEEREERRLVRSKGRILSTSCRV